MGFRHSPPVVSIFPNHREYQVVPLIIAVILRRSLYYYQTMYNPPLTPPNIIIRQKQNCQVTLLCNLAVIDTLCLQTHSFASLFFNRFADYFIIKHIFTLQVKILLISAIFLSNNPIYEFSVSACYLYFSTSHPSIVAVQINLPPASGRFNNQHIYTSTLISQDPHFPLENL